MAAVQSRAQHKVPAEQSTRANEDIEDFLLARIHPATVEEPAEKTKRFFTAASMREASDRVATSVSEWGLRTPGVVRPLAHARSHDSLPLAGARSHESIHS